MGLAVRSAARVEGVRAGVARCVMRVLARIWQSASATRRGDMQGTCAVDFAGGFAPRTPGIAPVFAPSGGEREPCFSCECTNIDAAAMAAVPYMHACARLTVPPPCGMSER